MTAAPIQASMAAGEIGPPLWGRTDLAWQSSAAKELENFIPTPHGPVKFAGGMRYISDTENSAETCRLIDYRFSVDDAYMLMFGDQNIRFGREKGRIESPPGTPVELTSAAGVPWPHTALDRIRAATSFDVLYLFHYAYAPRTLVRASHTSWTIPAFDFKDGPYYPENVTATTLTPSATTGNITITASAVTGINNGQGFLAGDVGRHVRYRANTSTFWGWAKITGITSTTVVTATVQSALAGATAQPTWRLGLWSDTTGWPAAVCLHEGRLATVTAPLWSVPLCILSESGKLDTFGPSTLGDAATLPAVTDASSVVAPLTSGQLNTPFDMKSQRDLLVLTAGKEFRVTSGSLTEAITPTNVKVIPSTSHGTTPGTGAIEVFDKVVFVQRDKRTLLAMEYEAGKDGFAAKDLTIRAPDIGRSGRGDASGGFKELAWAQSPNYLLHAVRNDGVMPTLTYLPDQEVNALMRHRRGPSSASACAIESVAVIPYQGIDQTWVVTKRTIGGATKRMVEILEEPLGQDDPIEDAFYVDCGLTLDNTGTVLGYGTLTPGVGADTQDATGVLFTASTGAFTTADHVGKRLLYRYLDTVNYRAGRHPRHKHLVWKTASALITARNSATVVQATIEAPFPASVVSAAIAATDWRLTVASVSGLSHLNGETVKVWGDGAPQADKTVSGGAITLETPAATVHVGLFAGGVFEPILQMDPRAKAKKARVIEVRLYLYRSLGGKATAYDPDNAETKYEELIPRRTSRDKLFQAPEEFSGWSEPIPVPAGWEDDPHLFIEQDIPGPMTIRAIAPVFDASGP
jgi:hypothetical protein